LLLRLKKTGLGRARGLGMVMEHVFQPLVGRSSTIQELHREQRTMASPAARGPAGGRRRACVALAQMECTS